MSKILEGLHSTLIAGLVLLVLAAIGLHGASAGSAHYWSFIFRLVHVWTGVLWIGLLYYFNFVQIPSMPKIPDEQKPAVSKVIAPTALFFFRWAAAATVLFGLITAYTNGYLPQALMLQVRTIGLGMWLAIVMAANVWFVIWPNQQRVLGLVEADADSKKKSARLAMLASRFNTMLSIPMLYCMVGQANAG